MLFRSIKASCLSSISTSTLRSASMQFSLSWSFSPNRIAFSYHTFSISRRFPSIWSFWAQTRHGPACHLLEVACHLRQIRMWHTSFFQWVTALSAVFASIIPLLDLGHLWTRSVTVCSKKAPSSIKFTPINAPSQYLRPLLSPFLPH